MKEQLSKFDAIILAGGLGSRLKSVVSNVPKPLALVNQQPFLDKLLEQINKFAEIKSVILAIGYKAEHIITRYSNCNKYNFDIKFSIEDNPLGTGGAIKKAISYVESKQILVMNGDSFIDFNLTSFIGYHNNTKADITFLIKKMDDVSQYSSIIFDETSGKISAISKKGETKGSGYINAGCYLMDSHLFDSVQDNKTISFEDEIFPLILNSAYGKVLEGRFIDIGTPESYKKANTSKFWDDNNG